MLYRGGWGGGVANNVRCAMGHEKSCYVEDVLIHAGLYDRISKAHTGFQKFLMDVKFQTCRVQNVWAFS